MLEEAEAVIRSIGPQKLLWFFEFAGAIGWFEQFDAA